MIPGSAISLLLTTAGPAFNPRDFMDVKLYTGNGSTQTISGLNFEPSLVWCKVRGLDSSHNLWDAVRGPRIQLQSNTTNSEYTESAGYGLTAFNSDGFTLGLDNQGPGRVNSSGEAFVAWTWDAGTTTASNPDGSITSQVRANASAGFSVVTYSASAGATIGHGLGVAPQLIIAKSRTSGATDWVVYSSVLGRSQYLALNATSAAGSLSNYWGTADPTSTVFGVYSSTGASNNAGNMVAYCFAPVAGYSSFGSYTGNGSATGPVISGLGFQPYFVMIKASSTTGDWWMYDGARSPSNPRINKLKANTSGAEDTAGEDVDFQSDGFQIKTSDSGLNQNTATYIYAAFA